MKLTNKQLVEGFEAVQALAKLKLPIKTSYHLSRNLKQVKASLEDFDTARSELINRYGTKDENGKLKQDEESRVAIPDVVGFQKELNDLLTIEIELDITPLKLEELGDSEFETVHLMTLDWLINE